MMKKIRRSVSKRMPALALACMVPLAAVVTLATSAVVAKPASASDLFVKYDQSQLIRMPRPVSEIIIGNPTIADVVVKSGDLLVITGKSFGITNIIALDAQRNVIQDQRIIVQRDELATVNLQLGENRRSYNCSPQCNPSVTVGDESDFYNKVSAASRTKISMSENVRSGGERGR